MLSIPFYPRAASDQIILREQYEIQNDDGSDLADTLIGATFLLVDSFGKQLMVKTINDGLSWDQANQVLTLEIENVDVAFANSEIEARYSIFVQWDNGSTQVIVPPAGEDYDFAKVYKVL